MTTLSILLLFYVLLLLSLYRLFSRRLPGEIKTASHAFSIIVAARNEEERLTPLIESLKRLDYSPDHYEVLFVNDASRDNTGNLLQSACTEHPHWHYIEIEDGTGQLPGKKEALHRAIAESNGDYIAVTDADCRVPAGWLKSLAAYFDDNTVMLLGHSTLVAQKGFTARWLKMDNIFSGIMVALPAVLGFPISSVGRNMAYSKKAYLKSGGYPALAKHKSGDDVHLTELFRQNINGKIRFVAGENINTLTLPPATLSEIFQQQVRKNSKVLRKSAGSIALALILFASHVALYGAPWFFDVPVIPWLGALVFKAASEAIGLKGFALKLGENEKLHLLFLFALFYPIYVSFFAILGLTQRYSWKR